MDGGVGWGCDVRRWGGGSDIAFWVVLGFFTSSDGADGGRDGDVLGGLFSDGAVGDGGCACSDRVAGGGVDGRGGVAFLGDGVRAGAG